ncbi:MAG: hypothetical protein B7Z55_15720 [Planctomycetales bacterium 12-60-4]|nr:MAG: hypothetical protein B7Z55_15720 [Planctomycetales bacterium 12-60-4]
MHSRTLWVIPALVLTSLVTASAEAPILGRNIGSWKLADFRGREWSSSEFTDRKFQVVAFFGVECPLAKQYAPVLQRIADEFADQGVSVVILDSNRHDSLTEMAAFARQFDVRVPVLKDLNNVIADRLGAERTPEVFVLDPAGKVRYHGRIDDQHSVGGRSRPEPTRHDLRQALEDLC